MKTAKTPKSPAAASNKKQKKQLNAADFVLPGFGAIVLLTGLASTMTVMDANACSPSQLAWSPFGFSGGCFDVPFGYCGQCFGACDASNPFDFGGCPVT